jgi:hypothetical protein
MARDKDTPTADRMLKRTRTRMVKRASSSSSEVVLRLSEREKGARTTRAPGEIPLLPREAGAPQPGQVTDLRSAVARKVAEMVNLSAERGLLREVAARDEAAAAATGSATPGEDQGDMAVYNAWYQELKGAGLSEPEIEEHMAARVRAMRAQYVGSLHARHVGRLP